MGAESVLVLLCGAVLVVAAVLTLVRIVRGPSVLDRTVAVEVMIAIMICAFGLQAAVSRTSTTLPILLSLALVGFVGSVTIARFVARDHDRGSDEARTDGGIGRDGADTGPGDQAAGPSGSRGAGGPMGDQPSGRGPHDV